jgi:O-antigen/teichoic acid export membrane protein
MKFLRADIFTGSTLVTTTTKFAILLANFMIVVVTAHLWGSNGRGEIALVIANISVINILSNIFCGSTVTFHASREDRDLLFLAALAGSFLLSLCGSLVFSLYIGFGYFRDLFIISFLSSLTGTFSMYWLGVRNIKLYNILTFLNPVLVLLYLLTFYFIFNLTTINACFYAYYSGLGTLLVIGILSFRGKTPFRFPVISLNIIGKIVRYGFPNEASYFIQFLNYRLSYFFIAKWLGLSQLGIFSIAVSCAEAIWIISKSMSTVLYSNVVNTTEQKISIEETTTYAAQSFWISLLFMGLIVIMPKAVFEYAFGSAFGGIKTYLIYLMPGILAIAVSNLYGHYFAGVGNLKILIKKSAIGLIATLIFLLLLTKKYYLNGVCFSLNVSYLLSSLYLFFKFRNEKKKYHTTDIPVIAGENDK